MSVCVQFVYGLCTYCGVVSDTQPSQLVEDTSSLEREERRERYIEMEWDGRKEREREGETVREGERDGEGERDEEKRKRERWIDGEGEMEKDNSWQHHVTECRLERVVD